MKPVDVAIIGAGVVGCAIARELSTQARDVVLLEWAPKVGMMTSTRNSGVLHSGIYYLPGSLKARLCPLGNHLTKEFCAQYGVSFRNCGKLVVAFHPDETPQLERLAERGRDNGVEGLRVIETDRIRALEPNIVAAAALEVPSAAVVNTRELVKAYARIACDEGVRLLTEARVTALEPLMSSIVVGMERGSVPAESTFESFVARCVINAAGLYADDVAALLDGQKTCRIYPVRGEYARIQHSKAHLINGLVYPLPQSGTTDRDVEARRIHLVRNAEGDLLVGPTARYVGKKNDYESDLVPLADFSRGIVPLLPDITTADLRYAFSGLRPQLVPPGQHGTADYVIGRSTSCPRLLNLIGMESPALTSAPAIARYIAPMVGEILA